MENEVFNMPLDALLEAVLFYKGEPMRVAEIAKLLGTDEQRVREALQTLEKTLEHRGIQLMRKDDEVELRTASALSELIEAMRKEDLGKELGKAGIETLSIILYKGQATRAEIDYIRGVNSTFIIRMLLIRGLIERVPNPKDQRSFLYKPTFDLLAFMGVRATEDLPEFETIEKELASKSVTNISDDNERQ